MVYGSFVLFLLFFPLLFTTFEGAFVFETLDGFLRMACDCKLAQNQRVTGVTTYEAGEQKLLSIGQHKPDGVRKNQQRHFFFYEADDAVRNFDLCTVPKYCLVVERWVKVNSFLGHVKHSLNQDVRAGCTNIVFKNWFALLCEFKLVFYKVLSRRLWYILIIILRI